MIVVDCAPTGETLRLLSFPDAARWWLDKVLGSEQSMLSAARPLARMFLDVQLPDEKVVAEVQKLVKNLVAMHELLRDASRVSMRLVMTPDRMVVAEAMRTFTYLNLYGYLTDAVVVNRVFPDELADGYFGAWHAVQQEQLELVAAALRARPGAAGAVLRRNEVIGAEPLDLLGDGAVRRATTRRRVLHDRVTQELRITDGRAELRLDLPFASKGDVKLKKIGLELIVRVDGHKRTIVLPGAIAGYKPISDARRRRPDRGLRAWLSLTARPTRPPNDSCARPTAAPRRPPARRRGRPRPTAGPPEPPPAAASRTSTPLSRCSRVCKGTLPPELPASSRTRCASC